MLIFLSRHRFKAIFSFNIIRLDSAKDKIFKGNKTVKLLIVYQVFKAAKYYRI